MAVTDEVISQCLSGPSAVLPRHSLRDWYTFPHRDETEINSVFPIQTRTFLIISNHLKSSESPQHEYLPVEPLFGTG